MRILTKLVRRNPTYPPVHVSLEDSAPSAADHVFSDGFTIGRDEACDVQVDSSLASRRHVEVRFENGSWWVHDLDSTNGTFVNDQRIDHLQLTGQLTLQLGKDGPSLRLEVEQDPAARSQDGSNRKTLVGSDRTPATSGSSESPSDASQSPPQDSDSSSSSTPRYTEHTVGKSAGPSQSDGPNSVDSYIDHYFVDDGRPAGDHTILIRRAYAEVQKKERRKYTWLIAGVVLMALGIAGFAAYQHLEMQRQEKAAAELFYEMKEQALATARFKVLVEETGNADLDVQMAELERRRQRMASRYDGYVKELGIYRRLTEEEQVIYDVARIFNESEFQMPAGFVREVRAVIDNYWLQAGKGRFIRGVRRAEEMGYTPIIVETLQRHGLPPEFFYLALQESDFDERAVGTHTRWGIAKGMWQFIPSTGRRFGLSIGPREDMRVFDAQDDRHDFERSTEAAAKYLLEIYSTLAQASGLLVIASYNWGEHRIVNKLESLPGPQSIPVEAFEGIPEDPRERNYWRFLGEYSDRMPEQTKDYVLKIFAAAVIGQNPRLFGIDLDNTLQPYMEAQLAQNDPERSDNSP